MANEGGEWIMKGLDWDNPFRIRSWRELVNWINEVGFLPLFANEATGFSAEEHVSPFLFSPTRRRDFPRRSMSLRFTGGPEIPSRTPGNGARSFLLPARWRTGSSSITKPGSFHENGSLTLRMPAETDMTSMRRGMTNWFSAGIKRSQGSLFLNADRTAVRLDGSDGSSSSR